MASIGFALLTIDPLVSWLTVVISVSFLLSFVSFLEPVSSDIVPFFKMVCISCFIAPVVLFIWYKFVYPVVQPLLDRFFGNYQLPQPFANLSCPLPKKSVKSCSSENDKQKGNDEDQVDESNEAASTSGDHKKDN